MVGCWGPSIPRLTVANKLMTLLHCFVITWNQNKNKNMSHFVENDWILNVACRTHVLMSNERMPVANAKIRYGYSLIIYLKELAFEFGLVFFKRWTSLATFLIKCSARRSCLDNFWGTLLAYKYQRICLINWVLLKLLSQILTLLSISIHVCFR